MARKCPKSSSNLHQYVNVRLEPSHTISNDHPSRSSRMKSNVQVFKTRIKTRGWKSTEEPNATIQLDEAPRSPSSPSQNKIHQSLSYGRSHGRKTVFCLTCERSRVALNNLNKFFLVKDNQNKLRTQNDVVVPVVAKTVERARKDIILRTKNDEDEQTRFFFLEVQCVHGYIILPRIGMFHQL